MALSMISTPWGWEPDHSRIMAAMGSGTCGAMNKRSGAERVGLGIGVRVGLGLGEGAGVSVVSGAADLSSVAVGTTAGVGVGDGFARVWGGDVGAGDAVARLKPPVKLAHPARRRHALAAHASQPRGQRVGRT
jgi:hypothetical protein